MTVCDANKNENKNEVKETRKQVSTIVHTL